MKFHHHWRDADRQLGGVEWENERSCEAQGDSRRDVMPSVTPLSRTVITGLLDGQISQTAVPDVILAWNMMYRSN